MSDAPRTRQAGAHNRTEAAWMVAPMGTWAPGTALHAALVRLWDEGHSCAEIGRRLGYSKNAIVGARKRNDLPERGSPIHPTATPSANTLWLRKWRAAIRAGREITRPARGDATLAPLGGEPHVARRAVVAPPAVVPAPAPYGRVRECCWPIGEPHTPGFRFCEAASLPGKPYCGGHCLVAYMRVRDRREDAWRT